MEGTLRRIHCRTHMLRARCSDLGDHLARRLVINGERSLARNALAVDQHFDGLHCGILRTDSFSFNYKCTVEMWQAKTEQNSLLRFVLSCEETMCYNEPSDW